MAKDIDLFKNKNRVALKNLWSNGHVFNKARIPGTNVVVDSVEKVKQFFTHFKGDSVPTCTSDAHGESKKPAKRKNAGKETNKRTRKNPPATIEQFFKKSSDSTVTNLIFLA
jgi:hypothetical protein